MKDDHSIYRTAWLFIFIFGVLSVYIAYFTIVESKSIAVHPYNKRLDHLEEEVIRGNIYDQDGTLLATSEGDTRIYPFGTLYSHVVGYSKPGKYGLEALANVELLYPDYSIQSLFNYAFNEERFNGHHVMTTLSHRLQQAAQEALGNQTGAVVVLEPTTGKIKAMYASPAFDPNTLQSQWETLRTDATSPLLNRATQGLYPPASVFKIVTAAAAIEEGLDTFEYNCEGQITQGGHTIACYNNHAHGVIDLTTAFEESCNTYFIALSEVLSPKALQKTAERLLFNTSLSKTLIHNTSKIALTQTDHFDTLAAYIGQGTTLVTPLHMAMLASIIYNDGVLMTPYMLDYSMDGAGNVQYKSLPDYAGTYMDESTAQRLQQMMMGVVTSGTASRLSVDEGVTVGGKTGTAQNETNKDHSWFVGFAEATDTKTQPIVFAIIVEQGGKGAKALDVAQMLLNTYFD